VVTTRRLSGLRWRRRRDTDLGSWYKERNL